MREGRAEVCPEPQWVPVGREESGAGFGILQCRWRRYGRRSLLASPVTSGELKWHLLLIQLTARLVEADVTCAATSKEAQPWGHGCGTQF